MKTIKWEYPDGDYCIISDKNNLNPYAVMRWTGDFWHQVSPWYYRKGSAVRFYNKAIAKEKES